MTLDEFQLATFQRQVNAERNAQIIAGKLTDKKIRDILSFAVYVKRIRTPPAHIKRRAHNIFRRAAQSCDIKLGANDYEHTFFRLIDALWNALSEDEQYRRMRAIE